MATDLPRYKCLSRVAEVLNRVICQARRHSAPAQINMPRDFWTQVIDIELPRIIECHLRMAEQWLDIFAGHDVPAQLVHTPREAADSAQAVARGLVQSLEGERHLPFPAVTDDGPAGRLRSLAPALGAHTDEILAELGFSTEERTHLMRSGACQPIPSSTSHGA